MKANETEAQKQRRVALELAAKALIYYDEDEVEPEYQLSDLLANLMHWADTQGPRTSFKDALDRAGFHYAAEVDEYRADFRDRLIAALRAWAEEAACSVDNLQPGEEQNARQADAREADALLTDLEREEPVV